MNANVRAHLRKAHERLEDANYALDSRAEVPRDVAEEQLRKASEFGEMAEDFLKATGGGLEP
jgi:hypothetical protein